MIRAAARRRTATALVATAAVTAATASSASAIEVNSLADPGNGNCGDGGCTLREAITQANSNPTTTDTITFAAGLSGTLRLASAQLEITSPMSIVGPGAGKVTISGDTDADGTGDRRILYVNSDEVTVSGLTLTDGRSRASSYFGGCCGGAVYAFVSDLTLENVVISDSDTVYGTGGFTGPSGGGVWANATDLTITGSTITRNEAVGGGGIGGIGGGIAAVNEGPGRFNTLEITDSTISGNSSGLVGGGLYASNLDRVEISGSTISGNLIATSGYGDGGGVFLNNLNSGAVEKTTIAGNFSRRRGVGLSLGDAPGGIAIDSTTIAGNVALQPDPLDGGVGLFRLAGSDGVTITNSVIADNTGAPDDYRSAPAAQTARVSHSLIESLGSTPLLQTPEGSNLLGVDPQLGPLADNGGPTQTMLPADASPIVDAGISSGLATDQRGLARTVDRPGVGAAGSDGTDMGAVELAAPPDSAGPALELKTKGKAKAGKPIKITVSSDEAATLVATATAKAGKRKTKFKRASGDVGAGGSTTLKLKLAKKPAKLLKRAGKGKAKVAVTATDSLGNASSEALSVKLK